MLSSRTLVQRWCFALVLICSPQPRDGRTLDAVSGRMRRSVTHAQLMHDKGRSMQDFKRRLWLQELLHEVHTAEIRDLQLRPPGGAAAAGGNGGVGGAAAAAPPPSTGLGMNLSTTGSTLHSKPPGGTKNLPVGFGPEEEEGTNLPQETHKSQTYKDGALKASVKKKKKARSRRRDGEKRKRRARSAARTHDAEPGSGFHLEWTSLLGLQGALL